MREVGHVPRFAEFFRGDDKREAFVALLGELETCQKSLSNVPQRFAAHRLISIFLIAASA